MDKEDGNISIVSGHETQSDSTTVSIQSDSKKDFEDTSYVQIAYGKLIKFPNMTRGKTFTRYGELVRVLCTCG